MFHEKDQQASQLAPYQLTRLLGDAMGFSEEDLRANHDGEFPSAQRMKILKKNGPMGLVLGLITVYSLLQVIPMWIDPVFMDDTILFTICQGGLFLMLIGAILLVSIGARGVIAALFERKIEQVEGITRASVRARARQVTKYYLEIPQTISLEVSKQVHDRWVNGCTARLFHTRSTKYLVGVEILRMPSGNDQV